MALVNDPRYLRIDVSKLPLELFDSTEFEVKANPATGSSTPTRPARHRAQRASLCIGSASGCQDCDVLSWTTEDATIRFRSQRVKRVRRINLRFDAENPDHFERRIWLRRRHETHAKRACVYAIL